MLTGGQLINRERQRHEDRGFDAAHDDEHGDGSLLHLGILLACDVAGLKLEGVDPPDINGPWPDQELIRHKKKHAKDEIALLVIAGAMVAAEIDRLKRAKARAENNVVR